MNYNNIEKSYDKTFITFQNHLMLVAFKSSILMIIIELLFFAYYYTNDLMDGMSVIEYILFYIVRPTFINCIAWIIGDILGKSKNIKKETKLSIPLIVFLVIASTCAATHCAFPILYGLIVIPIYASTIYADKKILKNITKYALIAQTMVTIVIYCDPYSTKPKLLFFNILLTYFCIFMTYYVSSSVILHEEKKYTILKQSVEYNKILEDELLIDGLTGLYNYRGLLNFTNDMISNTTKSTQIAILDVDNFKSINDTYGHEVGNVVLKKLGVLLQGIQSENIKVARYGGEEFAVLFINQEIEKSYEILDEVRKELSNYNFIDIPDKKITFSAGLSSYIQNMDIKDFFDSADKLLYMAKLNGKNQVIKETNK